MGVRMSDVMKRGGGSRRLNLDFSRLAVSFPDSLFPMPHKTLSSLTDQVTELLRQGMVEGRWRGTLPGRDRLAEELGCSHWTIEEALQRLAKEGLLVSQGAGRRRRIELPKDLGWTRSLRVMILLYEQSDRDTDYYVDLVHRLQTAGHDAGFAAKTMRELGMNVKRIARFVSGTEADAWVVVAGPRDVLEWFAGQATPTFALFGRSMEVPLASTSPKKAGALLELTDHLIDLGHRRIVMLAREERRKPDPGFLERLFLEHLEKRGIPTGAYNLPDWGDGPKGLRRILDSLFQRTPPTALIIGDHSLVFAVIQHLASLGITAPNQVSLACTDASHAFDWSFPEITHIAWDVRPLIQRVVKWADNISRGKDDRRKSSNKARLVVGGTIGPVHGGS